MTESQQTSLFLTYRDVLGQLRVGRTTLDRWIHMGRFPRPIKLAGQRVCRWKQETIATWLREQESQRAATI
jgi:predicted DNA-binding transcriptional regulator AlpA